MFVRFGNSLVFVFACLRLCACVCVCSFSTSAADCAVTAADCAVTAADCAVTVSRQLTDRVDRLTKQRRWIQSGAGGGGGDFWVASIGGGPSRQPCGSLATNTSTLLTGRRMIHTHTLMFHTHISYLRSHACKQTCTYLLIKPVGLGYNCYKLRTKMSVSLAKINLLINRPPSYVIPISRVVL